MSELDLLNLNYATVDQARSAATGLLADHPHGWSLPQPFYNDPSYFRLDMETIFQHEWLFVGMTSEIPSRGDYLTVDIGQNPVLIVRDGDGGIEAFHNVCRHRGSRLCTQPKGKVANLTCPYHQWTYNLKGNLLYTGTAMDEHFDPQAFALRKLHCRHAGGFIFVSLTPDEPPPFDEFLSTLDEYMAPYDMANTRVVAESTIEEHANWKLVLENNRECYHCAGSHPELMRTLLEWDDTNDPRATPEFIADYERQARQWDAEGIPHHHVDHGLRNRIVRMPLKSGTQVMTMDGKTASSRLLGRIRSRELGSMRILHLPNSWNHMQSDHVVVFRVLPVSAQRTLVTTKWLVHKDAEVDVDRLTHVWHATNRQDKELVEQNQLGVNSMGYQPGPYSETHEFGVINFVDWYRQALVGER
ncbi:MAG: aromatic ring-hydroxylating dioxygenase subunit alpha [Natronospirillum sp.]|uniref:aromatic ring-hydroxylating oxygenase subunit alpha n=1 Tax=Natronospirillum sp. TaxID=2812955 RepID=UPI0025FB37C1|nr:aromatic ring-hydroxylating dioxygenase subunit alpha [Natronospirillum sp.]MCH8553495.1 aromatic ring-hydroxylating dioxygenase subunit alpha [Natronospirillum sp.]